MYTLELHTYTQRARPARQKAEKGDKSKVRSHTGTIWPKGSQWNAKSLRKQLLGGLELGAWTAPAPRQPLSRQNVRTAEGRSRHPRPTSAALLQSSVLGAPSLAVRHVVAVPRAPSAWSSTLPVPSGRLDRTEETPLRRTKALLKVDDEGFWLINFVGSMRR